MQQALKVDYLLDIQLSNLDHVTLQRSYKETRYEDCLVRGLHRATLLFGGLDFTLSPHVRIQTADWVTSSCDRLFYVPQVLDRDSKVRARAEQIRRSIAKILRTLRYTLALLQSKLHDGNPQLTAKYLAIDRIIKNDKRPRVLPDVPYGFGLDCQNRPRCRLIHTRPANPANTVKSFRDAVTDARKEVEKWSYNFERMFDLLSFLIELLAWLQLMCVVQYLFATTVSMRRPAQEPKLTFAEEKARVWNYLCYRVAHVEPEENNVIGLLINTALYALFGLQLEYIIPEFGRLLFPVGLGFCVFHSAYAAVFIQPGPENYPDGSLHDAVRAVKKLCLIAQGIEPPEPAQTKALTSRPKTAPSAKPASKIAARFISPLTPIAEDLQQECKAMHAEQGKPLNYAEELSGYVPETEEEYDSGVEHATYVDLAGGVTLTDSDDDLVLVGE